MGKKCQEHRFTDRSSAVLTTAVLTSVVATTGPAESVIIHEALQKKRYETKLWD